MQAPQPEQAVQPMRQTKNSVHGGTSCVPRLGNATCDICTGAQSDDRARTPLKLEDGYHPKRRLARNQFWRQAPRARATLVFRGRALREIWLELYGTIILAGYVARSSSVGSMATAAAIVVRCAPATALLLVPADRDGISHRVHLPTWAQTLLGGLRLLRRRRRWSLNDVLPDRRVAANGGC